MFMGRLQSLPDDLLLQVLAGETCPYARREVFVRLHRQRLQNEVQLAGEKDEKTGRYLRYQSDRDDDH